MKESEWTGSHLLAARRALGLSQTQLAKSIGWKGKQRVSDLERGHQGKTVTTQTALAVECLLRREGKWGGFIKAQAARENV